MNDIQRRLSGIEIKELEQQMDEFFSRGGVIDQVPDGYSRFNQKVMPVKEFTFKPGVNSKLASNKPRYPSSKRPPGASGVKGIHKVRGKWRATHEGHSIGMFADRDDAIAAQAKYIKQQESAQKGESCQSS